MKFLIVSLHDVSPHTWESSRQILEDLRTAGVEKTSLLVIPDHHHRGLFLQNAAFCDWLREMNQAGHEIVTHGYFHQREPANNESTRDKMITQIYTAGEGEFFDISEPDALQKMRRAQDEFASIDLHPTGFIAPAWLLSEAGERAARQTGFLYTTTLGEIKNFSTDQNISSQSLVYSVRSGWRRACSRVWNPFLARRLRRNPVIRLGIHPPDWKYPAIRNQILALVTDLAKSRTATTYASFVSSSLV